MKANQNNSVESPHNTTDTTNGQATRFPRCRSKAEIKAERLSWAMWATAVYLSECCPTNTLKPSSNI